MTTGSGTFCAASSRLRRLCHSQNAPADSGRMIDCGIAGMQPITKRMHATGSQIFGSDNCPPIWSVRLRASDTRVTITAAAIDSSSAGTEATSASPTASVM